MNSELPIRVRQDLEFFERNRGQWVVKDPISFTHFLFTETEMGLLRLFDGRRSFEDVRREWQRLFRTQALTLGQVRAFADRLVRDHLVTIERFGVGPKFQNEKRERRKQSWAQKFSSPLVIKLGGVDPTPVLNWLGGMGKVFFQPLVIIFMLLGSMAIFGYFLSNFEEIVRQLPTAAQFFAAKNLVVMMVVIVVVKILHELGHALACRNYGGECLEIGVLLLAFLPTLYCDVSDSWTFRERWKRIMVSFAGIYVEVMLASLAAVIWLLTEPSLLQTIAFNVVVMCSLNTLFVNGNPLLKYDGYYIVSDFFEQPNLAQRSKRQFRAFWTGMFCDLDERSRTDGGWLTLFGGLSTVYRWTVLVAIIFGVYLFMKPLGVGRVGESVVLVLALMVGYRMVVQSRAEQRQLAGRWNWYRATASLLVMGVLTLLFFTLPLPSYVYCQFEVVSERPDLVYAPRDGRLNLLVEPGDEVVVGQAIAVLEDRQFFFQVAQAESRLAHLNRKRERMERRLDGGAQLVSELNVIRNEIEKQRNELELLQGESDQFNLAAAKSGVLRALTSRKSSESSESAPFAPMLTEHNDCLVRRGQPLYTIDGVDKKLVAVVGEKSVEELEPGQAATLQFFQWPQHTVPGRLDQIVVVDVQLTEAQTQRLGLEITVDQAGNRLAAQTSYRLVLKTGEIPQQAFVGSAGKVRISVPSQTAAVKLWRMAERWWSEQN